VPFGANAGYITWSTVEKQTLTLRQGVMTATRGLGDDLMSSDVSATIRAIASGGGDDIVRVLRHLDGDDQTIETRFTCRLTTAGRETITLSSGENLATTRLVERCVAGNQTVENIYWKDTGGTVRRSRQWISASLGYILIDVLRA
jgi:hypothetical protein